MQETRVLAAELLASGTCCLVRGRPDCWLGLTMCPMASCPSEQQERCQEDHTPTKHCLHIHLLRPALANDQASHFGYFFRCSPGQSS